MSTDQRYRQLLEIRQQLGKSSTAKYQPMLNMLRRDGRVGGVFLYHGAGTGRWSGKGIQPQNLPSRGLPIKADEVPVAIEAAQAGCLDLCYKHPMEVASACIRGMLWAAPAHRFLCADYNAIEGRVLAWVAQDPEGLDPYFEGKDPYKVVASWMFDKPYDQVTKDERTAGKPGDLGLGYGGGIGAFNKMAQVYRVDYDKLAHAMIPKATDEERIKAKESATTWLCNHPGEMQFDHAVAADLAKQKWRGKRGATVSFWRGVEDAAIQAVEEPGVVFKYLGVAFKCDGRFLKLRLPSKRLLYYCDPSIEMRRMPWKDKSGAPVEKPVVCFMGVHSMTKKWGKASLYGGLITENICQAIARDILAEAILRLEAAGYPVVLHVHDEIVCEVPWGYGSLQELTDIMCSLPSWASGLPLKANGWEGQRYKKDD